MITIFAIVGASDPERLGEALNANFAGDYIQIPRTANYFVVASPQVAVTAKQVSDKLGITDGSNGSAVVLNVAGYYGRTDPEIWEWLAAKLQQAA